MNHLRLILQHSVKNLAIKDLRQVLLLVQIIAWTSIALAATSYTARFYLEINPASFPKISISQPISKELSDKGSSVVSQPSSEQEATLANQRIYPPVVKDSMFSGAEVFFVGVASAVLIGLLRYALDIRRAANSKFLITKKTDS
jgi:hypothetical protein